MPPITAPLAPSPSEEAGLTGIAGFAVDVMGSLGEPGAALLIAAENLFPPIPSEIILPLAGFTAAQDGSPVWRMILWCTLGSVVGALALYWVGAAFGHARIMRWLEKLPLVDADDLTATTSWFARHGRKAIFFGRMVPLFRSLISVPAGIERMPLLSFAGLTAAGSAIWNTIFVIAGYTLGANWHLVDQWAGYFSDLVYIGIVVVVVWWVVKRILRNRRRARAAAAPGADAE
jgi:membrane protein DedA with SNARE-associated domain